MITHITIINCIWWIVTSNTTIKSNEETYLLYTVYHLIGTWRSYTSWTLWRRWVVAVEHYQTWWPKILMCVFYPICLYPELNPIMFQVWKTYVCKHIKRCANYMASYISWWSNVFISSALINLSMEMCSSYLALIVPLLHKKLLCVFFYS